jgi:hypothetical protein
MFLQTFLMGTLLTPPRLHLTRSLVAGTKFKWQVCHCRSPQILARRPRLVARGSTFVSEVDTAC